MRWFPAYEVSLQVYITFEGFDLNRGRENGRNPARNATLCTIASPFDIVKDANKMRASSVVLLGKLNFPDIASGPEHCGRDLVRPCRRGGTTAS